MVESKKKDADKTDTAKSTSVAPSSDEDRKRRAELAAKAAEER